MNERGQIMRDVNWANSIWQSLVVFAAMFALDFVWAKYTFAMTDRHPYRAGGYAGAICLLAGIAQIGYTADPWLLIPALIGAFGGTVLAVRMK